VSREDAWSVAGVIVPRAALVAGVTCCRLIGQSRARGLVRARRVAMLAMRSCGMSLPQIGEALGGRDHTTVLHHLAQATDLERAEADALASMVRV
jgi:chromosomal replication initiator protein